MLRSGRCPSATRRCARHQTKSAKVRMAGRTPATDRSGATNRSRTSGRPPAAGRWCGQPSATSRSPAAAAALMLAACAAGVRTDRDRVPGDRARAAPTGNVRRPEEAASTHADPNSADREPRNRLPVTLVCGARVSTGEHRWSAESFPHRQRQAPNDRAMAVGRQKPAGHCPSAGRYRQAAPSPSAARRGRPSRTVRRAGPMRGERQTTPARRAAHANRQGRQDHHPAAAPDVGCHA
jgi:hypothetical protein